MLYAFIGSDVAVSTEKARAFVAKLLVKEPFATQVVIAEETYSAYDISELLHSAGLFKDKLIIKLQYLLSAEGLLDDIKELLPACTSSEHIVVLVDGDLKKKERDTLASVATLVTISDSAVRAAVPTRNPFAITDALFARNGKQLFVDLEEV
jgi:DNA polymerase III delta subunit